MTDNITDLETARQIVNDHARQSLGQIDGDTRRITDPLPQPKAHDLAVVQQATALVDHVNAQQALQRSKDAVMNAVRIAYNKNVGKGETPLNDDEIKVVALVAHSHGLNPDPWSGELYAWKQNNALNIAIGYKAYVIRAQQQYIWFHKFRGLTPEEKTRYKDQIEPGDVVVMCEVYEQKKAQLARLVGIDPEPIRAIGVWKKAIKTKWGSKPDNIPTTWTAQDVAEKRALIKCLRFLGIEFDNTGILKENPGMIFDDMGNLTIEAPAQQQIAAPEEGHNPETDKAALDTLAAAGEAFEGEFTPVEPAPPIPSEEETNTDQARKEYGQYLDGLHELLKKEFPDYHADFIPAALAALGVKKFSYKPLVVARPILEAWKKTILNPRPDPDDSPTEAAADLPEEMLTPFGTAPQPEKSEAAAAFNALDKPRTIDDIVNTVKALAAAYTGDNADTPINTTAKGVLREQFEFFADEQIQESAHEGFYYLLGKLGYQSLERPTAAVEHGFTKWTHTDTIRGDVKLLVTAALSEKHPVEGTK